MSAQRSAHILPCRSRRPDRQLPQLLPLLQILHFRIDQIPQPLQIHTSLRPRAHEHVPPNARSSDGVVDRELERPVEAHHLLHEVVRTGIHGVWPGNSDSEPPS